MRRRVGTPSLTTSRMRECPGCGTQQLLPALAPGMTAQCARCSTVLHRASLHTLDRSIALTTAALALLVMLCLTPLMQVQTVGLSIQAGLFSGPHELMRRDMASLAIVIVFVVAVAPLVKLLGSLYVLIRAHEANPPRHLRRVFALVERLTPWSMLEVFVFGVFVAYVKLGDLVQITLEIGVYILLALTFVLMWVDGALDREEVWTRLYWQRADATDPVPHGHGAVRPGSVGCESCHYVSVPGPGHAQCPRCDSALHPRKPNSLTRTWALVIAAAVLYIPANYFPVLTVIQLGSGQPSTILGGVEELISSRMYPLAALVFFASIAVPMGKLIGLSVLLIMTHIGAGGWLRDRTRLYYVICWIGRWSMIDIFMEALLGALVRFGNAITIEPGIGAVAFCGVVILTIVAAESFDPRLMWDEADRRKTTPAAIGDRDPG